MWDHGGAPGHSGSETNPSGDSSSSLEITAPNPDPKDKYLKRQKTSL